MRFMELAQQVAANPADANFTDLRTAYQTSDVYRPFKHISQQKLMNITNHVNNFTEVAATCQNILDANPMDLEARMMLAVAQENTGKPDAAEKNHLFAQRMIDAILNTGTGKSFDGAWQLVSDQEAWTVMRIFGMKAKSYERVFREDKIYDVYQGKIDDRDATMYFDVTHPVQFVEDTIS
jgi:hypothetical protein